MKTSSFILALVIAFIIGAGAVAIYLFNPNVQTQVFTGETLCVPSSTDSDGDCATNQEDYYPNEATK